MALKDKKKKACPIIKTAFARKEKPVSKTRIFDFQASVRMSLSIIDLIPSYATAVCEIRFLKI